MYTYMYIYIYMHICIYMFIQLYIYILIHLNINIFIYLYSYIFIHKCRIVITENVFCTHVYENKGNRMHKSDTIVLLNCVFDRPRSFKDGVRKLFC